jgi:Ser/Thr protein kinase RdoA (MazF antagonist)
MSEPALAVYEEPAGEAMTRPDAEVMRAMAAMAASMASIAASMDALTRRMDELEREVRWNTPLTPVQARRVNEAIRERARALLKQMNALSEKRLRAARKAIRKSALKRYGVSKVSELPKAEYQVVMRQVEAWKELGTLKEILEEY